MENLDSQMAMYVAAGAVVGLLLGWWSGRWSAGRRLTGTVSEWQQRHTTAEAARVEAAQEVQRLSSQVADLNVEVEKTRDRAAEAIADHDEVERRLDQERQRAAHLGDELEQRDSLLTELREEIETWRDEVGNLQREQLTAEENLERLTSDLASARDRQAELDGEVERLRLRAATADGTAAESRENEEELREQVERLRVVKREFQEWMEGAAAHEEELRHVRRELEEIAGERDELASEVEGLRRDLTRADEERVDAGEAEEVARQRDALRLELERRDDRIAELEERLAGLDGLEDESRRLRAELADAVRRAEDLEDSSRETESARRAADPAEPRDVDDAPLADPDDTPLVDVDRLPANQRLRDVDEDEKAEPQAPAEGAPELLSEPRGETDDLKRIRGIGPVLERTLNELGVFHFWQIAGWSQDEIEWIAAHINTFPDRIARDRWVAQAADLDREHRGGVFS